MTSRRVDMPPRERRPTSVLMHAWPCGAYNIQARRVRYMGKLFFDVRAWFQDAATGKMRPTKRGLRIPPRQLDELSKAIDAFTNARVA